MKYLEKDGITVQVISVIEEQKLKRYGYKEVRVEPPKKKKLEEKKSEEKPIVEKEKPSDETETPEGGG